MDNIIPVFLWVLEGIGKFGENLEKLRHCKKLLKRQTGQKAPWKDTDNGDIPGSVRKGKRTPSNHLLCRHHGHHPPFQNYPLWVMAKELNILLPNYSKYAFSHPKPSEWGDYLVRVINDFLTLQISLSPAVLSFSTRSQGSFQHHWLWYSLKMLGGVCLFVCFRFKMASFFPFRQLTSRINGRPLFWGRSAWGWWTAGF